MVINIRVLREVPLRTKWLASFPPKTCGNSGTTEPATLPVVPLFQKSPKSEVIIRKNAEQSPETTVVC